MVAPKSPRRNNRARWFLVSAFALLRLVIVRPTATDTTDDTANTPRLGAGRIDARTGD
jgi:hypothetical protein